MNERPEILLRLGRELQRVAAEEFAGEVAAPRRVSLRRASGRLSLVAAAAIGLALAAAATAAVLLIQQGSPLPAPHVQDLRSSGIPLPGSARLAGLDAPDPDRANPPWDLRLSRTASGEICTAVGQVLNGRFGIVGLDHVFRELPLGSVDSCGIESPGGPVLVGAHSFVGLSASEARTVLSGVAGDGTRSVTAYSRGTVRHLALGPEGSFITVYEGEAEAAQPRVVIVGRDGRSHTIALEQGPGEEAPDPSGGSGWVVSAEPDLEADAFPDEDCVQATRQPSQSEASHVSLPLTPEVCGRLGSSPLMVSMRRFVPGEDATPYPWGEAPSRTLVYGIATPRVASLSLIGEGQHETVAIDRHGGGFLAVLDGHVDPRNLRLSATLRDGRTAVYRQSTQLYSAQGNRPLAPAAVPAYRAPQPLRSILPPFELPIASTVRETLRSPDPAGGPEWVVRSWQGRPNPRVRGAGGQRYYCQELGVLWQGRLVTPSARPSDYSQPVGAEGRCNGSRELTRMRYSLSLEAFLDDPYAYDPVPTRAVLSGMLPPGATDPVLLGVGPTRALRLDANGAFLVVLPGSDWNATPRISYLLNGRRVGRLVNPPHRIYQPGTEPQVPQVRAPDPDGGAPWGFEATRRCSTAIGRIVAGRLASIDPRNGVLKPGAEVTGYSSSCLTHPSRLTLLAPRRQPVEFDEQQVGSGLDPFAEEEGRQHLGQPEIERRTLPGRTIVTGIAEPDVVSVTLSTPSDVRTLRPSGPLHALLAVYDGYILRGKITAAVRLRGGRVETEQLLTPFAGSVQAPPLRERLRQFREQMTLLLRGREAREKRLGSSYRAQVVRIERRLAYEAAHPGLLPAE